MEKIRIGTRASRLARIQAQLVEEAILHARPTDTQDAHGRKEQAQNGQACPETKLVILKTKGDKILDKPLSQIGDKGLFVTEFEQALLDGSIDMAVHSAKDLPMRTAPGLEILAVLPRGDVRDVLVVKKGKILPDLWEKGEMSLPLPFVLGTGSKRRQLQAQLLFGPVSCKLIRGNVETRLGRLEAGEYDGILLAKAGLDRLGIGQNSRTALDFWELDPQRFLPAACQGVIAVEAREDSVYKGLLGQISDRETYEAFLVEREVLARLESGCSEAAAAWCRKKEGRLALDARYGTKRVSLSCRAGREEGLQMAREAAARLRL